jgi:hypothetical protein
MTENQESKFPSDGDIVELLVAFTYGGRCVALEMPEEFYNMEEGSEGENIWWLDQDSTTSDSPFINGNVYRLKFKFDFHVSTNPDSYGEVDWGWDIVSHERINLNKGVQQ